LMHLPSTPIETLERHHDIAKSVGLHYVYLGNVAGHPFEHTYCPQCGKVVVERFGFDITDWHLDDQNCCKYCGNEIAIIGKLSSAINEDRFVSVAM
jgi:pyruvate formate lyase activating enzyme